MEVEIVENRALMQTIQDDRESLLKSGNMEKHEIFAEIEGEMTSVLMLFIKKQKKTTEKGGGRHTSKKVSTYGKSQQEITQAQIVQFIDEQCQWESIYFEITDQNNETIPYLYDKNKIGKELSKDEFFDWRSGLA